MFTLYICTCAFGRCFYTTHLSDIVFRVQVLSESNPWPCSSLWATELLWTLGLYVNICYQKMEAFGTKTWTWKHVSFCVCNICCCFGNVNPLFIMAVKFLWICVCVCVGGCHLPLPITDTQLIALPQGVWSDSVQPHIHTPSVGSWPQKFTDLHIPVL